MSKLHLTLGSQLPILPKDGKLRLYSMRFCPYAQRIHLVLDAKKIPYHTINVNLKAKPEWLIQKSPLGKVPALEIPSVGGDPLIESLIIAEYLDDRYPEHPIFSKDPLQRARDKVLIERFSGISPIFYKLARTEEWSDETAKLMESSDKIYDIFEAELKARGTKFFFGSGHPGFLDYMIWPWVERITALPFVLGDKYEKPDKVRFASLIQWSRDMKQDSAVQASIISGENHYKFVQSSAAGVPQYDMLF